jgi:NTP pyrophosphatase (non-canonical NTP hydrolase)
MKELISKIEQWAEDRNIISGAKPIDQAMKLFAEHGELSENVGNNQLDKVFDDVGDVFVVLTIIAKQCNLSIYNHLNTKLKHSGLKVDVAFLTSELATIATEVYEWDNESTYFPEHALSYSVARLRSIAEQVGLTLEYCVEQAYNDISKREGILWNGVFIKSTHEKYAEIKDLHEKSSESISQT